MAIQEIRRGKYKIIVPLSYNGNKRKRHIEVFNGTIKEARLREYAIKMSIANSTYINKNNITVEQLFNEFLQIKQATVQPKTYKTYTTYKKDIIESLGHLKLKNVTAKILQDFYLELKTKRNLADKTVKHYYTLINSMFESAVKWDYIIRNPNSKVDKISVVKKQAKCYSPEEVQELVKALESENLKYKAIILLALDTGCRRGEITGLEWSDINFKKSCITINKATQYIAGTGIIEKGTKTESSNRTIYIADTTRKVLLQFQKEQYRKQLALGSKWQGSKKVFTTDFGANMHPDTPSAILKKIIHKHNLKDINFHGLRHTSISLQIASGIQAQIISKRAGHSSLAITHEIYSHFFDNEFKEVPQKIDAYLKAPILK